MAGIDERDGPAELQFIRADADYYRTKARQCRRMAERSHDEKAKTTLRSLGDAFEVKAQTLDD